MGLCFGQYTSRVSTRQPMCAHGRSGFCATGYHLRAKTKTPEPSHHMVHRLRRVGSGSFCRYSRRILCGSSCSIPRSAFPRSPATAAGLFAAGKSGKAGIRPLSSFYHNILLFAILFTPKKFTFPINKHYPKSEINARLSAVVSGGSIHSMYANSPNPLLRVSVSITSAPGGAVSLSDASTHPQ